MAHELYNICFMQTLGPFGICISLSNKCIDNLTLTALILLHGMSSFEYFSWKPKMVKDSQTLKEHLFRTLAENQKWFRIHKHYKKTKNGQGFLYRKSVLKYVIILACIVSIY